MSKDISIICPLSDHTVCPANGNYGPYCANCGMLIEFTERLNENVPKTIETVSRNRADERVRDILDDMKDSFVKMDSNEVTEMLTDLIEQIVLNMTGCSDWQEITDEKLKTFSEDKQIAILYLKKLHHILVVDTGILETKDFLKTALAQNIIIFLESY